MGAAPSTPGPSSDHNVTAPASRFRPLDVPARLWVPCAVRPPADAVRVKAEGSQVAAGEWLTEEDAESQPAPLAPAAGRVAGEGHVSLFNAREVPAVAIDTAVAIDVAEGAAATYGGAATAATAAGPDDPLHVPEPEEVVPAAPLAPADAEVIPSDFDPLPVAAVREFLAGLGAGDLDLAASIERLRTLGVWADRWTSPDLTGQLSACVGRPPDIVLCSLLDADPGLGVNRACAGAFPAEVVAAVAALARLTGAGRAWLVVDADEDAAAWAAVRRVAAAVAGDLRLVPVDNDYPQPDPTLLLYALTGRRLPPGQLPTDKGVLLLDAAAAAAVGRALVAGAPMLRVPLAVHDRTGAAGAVAAGAAPGGDGGDGGDGEGEAGDVDPAAVPRGVTHLVSAAVGTPLRDVLVQLGILPAADPDAPRTAGGHGLELRAGAPLREMRVTGDCVVAGTELGVFVAPREPDVNPDPCIRCGWCIEGCPVRIHPAGLLEAAQADDPEMARRYGLHACIECGICSYVCPSHLPLLHGIRTLRGERELSAEE